MATGPHAPALRCPHCGGLPARAQLHHDGSCGASACRLKADRARQQRLAATVGAATAADTAAALGRAPAATLWLKRCDSAQGPVLRRVREAHRRFLQGLVDEAGDDTVAPLPEPPPAVAPRGPQEGLLCAQCRGRCCHEGGPHHAFITLPQLLRWQRREPGRTLQDAVAHYTAAIAPRHTRRGCVYQGPQGCTLPREDRAEICNAYACDTLLQAREVLEDAPRAVFAVVTLQGDRALRRAALAPEGLLPLRRRR